jgi:small subunit ribosomal protein S9
VAVSQTPKPMPPTHIGKKLSHLGTGRRKTSVARVALTEGTGQVTINGRSVEDYFTEEKDRRMVYAPLAITDMRNRVDAVVRVSGGGFSGQAGAVTQGVARALKLMFGLTAPAAETASADGQEGQPAEGASSVAKALRDSGYLTRDSRMKERKKYGRKGARKSFQFSKR